MISYSIVWCPVGNKATLKSHGLSGVARVAELGGGGKQWQGFASGRTSIYARPKGLTLYWQGVWEPFKTPRSINDSGRMSHSELMGSQSKFKMVMIPYRPLATALV